MKKTAVLALLLSQPAQPENVEPVELRLKFEKGQILRFQVDQESSMNILGIQQTMNQVMKLRQEVLEVGEGGSARVRITYEAVRIRQQGLTETDYDSERDREKPDEPGARAMAMLVGRSLVCRIDPNGRVSEVRGMKEIVDAIADEFGEDSMEAHVIRQVLSEKNLRSMLEGGVAFPDRPVRPGDAWQDQRELELADTLALNIRTTYRLKELRENRSLAAIGMEMKMDFTAAEGSPFGDLLKVRDPRASGEMLFDLNRGVLRSSGGTMTLKMEAQEQEFEMTFRMEMKLLEERRPTEY